MNKLLRSRSPDDDKLPVDTRDAILTEAAAFNMMMEGMDHGAAKLREKAAQLRVAHQGATRPTPEHLS